MKSNLFSSTQSLLLAASVVLLLLFGRLYMNRQPVLAEAERAYATGNRLNLQPGLQADAITRLIRLGNYLTDPRDIALVADSLPNKLRQQGAPDNLGAINKRAFAIQTPTAWKSPIGGTNFQSRLRVSRQLIGFDSVLYNLELRSPRPYPSAVGAGGLSLSGQVLDNAPELRPLPDVLVQLKRHRPALRDEEPADSLTYARTDAEGRFMFGGLQAGQAYSVLPLKPGFEFGSRRGGREFDASMEVSFTARPHSLRLIGPVAYGQLKEDRAFSVRTPGEFRWAFWLNVVLFLLVFWLL